MFSKTHYAEKNQQETQMIHKTRPRNSKGKPRGLKCGGKSGTDGPISSNVVVPKQSFDEEIKINQFYEQKFYELGIEDENDKIKYRKDFEFFKQFSDATKDEFCSTYLSKLQDKGYENCFIDTYGCHEIKLPNCDHTILAVPIWCEIPMSKVKKMLPEAEKKINSSRIPILNSVLSNIDKQKAKEEEEEKKEEENEEDNDNDDEFILFNEQIDSSDISSSDEDSYSDQSNKKKKRITLLPKRSHKKFDDDTDNTDDDVQEIRLDQRMEHF